MLTAVLEDLKARPLEIMRALLEHFGVDWLTWESTVLRLTLERELHVQVPPTFLSRAMAASTVAKSDSFWEQWEHFHFLVQALCGEVPDHQNHAELTIGQMMRAVVQAATIRRELGKLSSLPEFSDEVARYVAAQALHDGIWYLPPPLDFAEKYACGLQYRCKDCGNVSEPLFDDGLCDVCVQRFDTSRLGAWRPDPERLAKGWGRNIEYFEKRPTVEVKKRLEEISSHPDKAQRVDAASICAVRLLAAREYAGYTEA